MALKTSRSGRLGKILGIGAQMVGKSVTGVLTAKNELEIRIGQARALAQGLSELKGASMKLGQMISLQGEHFLPKEVTDILSTLQNAAPAFAGSDIKKIVATELGEKFQDFETFEDKALAAASIGQVHRAKLKTGEQCVIKVQYPGIAHAIDSEIDLLQKVITPFARFYADRLDVPSLIEEVRTLLKQEVNYREEASFASLFKELLKDDPRFIVPKVFSDYSTGKILTLSYEEGLPLKTFSEKATSQARRNFAGVSIYELLMKEIFEFRMVQTDPNFGNYIFRNSDDEPRVVLLDFGATKRYSEEFISAYKNFAQATIRGDRQKVLNLADELGFLSHLESQDTKDLFYQMIELSIEPMRSDLAFDYSHSDLPKRISEIGFKFLRSVKKTPPPTNILFLNRKLGGVYNLLRTLGVIANFKDIHEKVFQI